MFLSSSKVLQQRQSCGCINGYPYLFAKKDETVNQFKTRVFSQQVLDSEPCLKHSLQELIETNYDLRHALCRSG